MTLRVVFMGTPDFAVPTLRAVADAGHDVRAVYSQPPRPAGRRGLAPVPSPVARAAQGLGIAEIRTPLSLKGEDEQHRFARLDADVAVVVAYGLILPQPILDAPRLGAFNGHASLLPRWRGAAPIQRAVEAGDAETGVMVMRMEAGLDTGPVALEGSVPIGPATTGGDLHDALAALGAGLMVEALARLEAGDLSLEPQDALAERTGRAVTYARKIDKSETPVDWTGAADAIARRINAFSPFPGAWTLIGGERVKLLRAEAGSASRGEGEPGTVEPGEALEVRAGDGGTVRLLQVQRAGGKPVSGESFRRGAPGLAGTRLHSGEA